MNQDEEHLRLLSIFHYVMGGIQLVTACIPLIHVAIGIVMLVVGIGARGGEEAPLAFVGAFFVLIGGTIILIGLTMGAGTIYAGRCIKRREHHMFCLVMAGVNCLNLPLGTILGVFTFIVLLRPTVPPLFAPLNQRETGCG